MEKENHLEIALALRKDESIASAEVAPSSASVLIHSVHTDRGVARNGGRRGARFGCQAILSAFRSLALPPGNNRRWAQLVASPPSLDKLDFDSAQEKETENLLNHWDASKKNFHLGGGHDHIYPLLMALEVQKKPIHVINIDAHLDTRTDAWAHSGTPFRQFAQKKSVPFRLDQIGIHPFCNPESSYQELPHTEMNIVKSLDELCLLPEEITVLSLDCDALSSSFLSGVSAINPKGLTWKELEAVVNLYTQTGLKHQPIVGIYEYNPLYDCPSGRGAKFLASFLWEMIFSD